MAKALGQEPVHVPHWMQALTMFRILAKESILVLDTVLESGSTSISSAGFTDSPF
jgi:hypothetical protein